MAQYGFSKRIVGRSQGRRIVQAAAYRAGQVLHDHGIDRDYDFTDKSDVTYSEILLPSTGPERWLDRETLWNEVERRETRKDAQLAAEVLVTLPDELGRSGVVALVREFVQKEMVDRGMVADINVHWREDDRKAVYAHAHILLTMRHATPDGFGLKADGWHGRAELLRWREEWANHVNERLATQDLEGRIDHRSFRAQGLALEPQRGVSLREARAGDAVRPSRRTERKKRIERENGERIVRRPELLLKALTLQQSTFQNADIARAARRFTQGADQFERAMAAVLKCRELVPLGPDRTGTDIYTSREMLGCERELSEAGAHLAQRSRHGATERSVRLALTEARQTGLELSTEQVAAVAHVVSTSDLALVVGYAGSGKSTMLQVAARIWARDGYNLQGVTLSGAAAENLQRSAGILSRTFSSLETAWSHGRDRLGPSDVLVVDEAGLLGSRQMRHLLQEADRAGAKVVLVGDPEQLQAIQAGAAFRALAERHGTVEITEVRRQTLEWQRHATRELATGQTHLALQRYRDAGNIEFSQTRSEAKLRLIERWRDDRMKRDAGAQLILAHTRAEVAELNALARLELRQQGELGKDHAIPTVEGDRSFATGDRIMFLRNEKLLAVRNGSLATLEAVGRSRMTARLDDGARVTFDPRTYNDISHGYAATIHKAQGLTVDGAYVLLSRQMDRHATYVALTRHRNRLMAACGRDDFRREEDMTRILGRARAKDTTLDYPDPETRTLEARARAFAARVASTVLHQTLEPDRRLRQGERER